MSRAKACLPNSRTGRNLATAAAAEVERRIDELPNGTPCDPPAWAQPAPVEVSSDKKALFKIEDQLSEIRAHAGVVSLAHDALCDTDRGSTSLALSLFAASRAIERLVDDIYGKLDSSVFTGANGVLKEERDI